MPSINSTECSDRRIRVLFLGESLSLCHITRPLVLASSLDATIYDVHFACHSDYHHLVQKDSLALHSLASLPSPVSLGRLAKGKPVFSFETLKAYVDQDLQLIDSIRPDFVVGDMRQSLAVSAPHAGTTYCSITNAYWSPYARRPFDVPELAITQILGPKLIRPFFRAAMPIAFRAHARPLNKLRQFYGLASIGTDLGDIYAWADHRFYADVPELVPTFDLPGNHEYIGPILWSSPTQLPDWWTQLPDNRPIIYVSPGSSGRADLLSRVLQSTKYLDVNIIADTSSRTRVSSVNDNVFVAPVLPAEKALERADLFIGHGGSASAYVSLANGTPILGIPSNMDQHLSIQYLESVGAGIRLRSEEASIHRIRNCSERMLFDGGQYQNAARRFANIFKEYDASTRFQRYVEKHIL